MSVEPIVIDYSNPDEPDPNATVVGYRAGLCRNDDRALSHTYAMMSDGHLWPMCGYGWNRSDGTRFSILRQPPGTEGRCKLCQKNVDNKKPPVIDGFPHRTKWL